ncbi:PREDICTED: uncharacterized protein At1g18380 [Brassica oleracea var. oleracea]|uniref:uncharacterized protein At1g18380 n=1 Tax=Brassica oleracea var. oleracea TaxID=109376 RepID=UPI0006A73567|nr:PREDICTED: uncharacterized protein At1g18380 [Brassica oleracea var. oleracea]
MKTTSFFFALSFSVFAVTVPSCFSADQQYEECALPLRCGPEVGNVSLRVNSLDLKNQTITVVEESLSLGGCPDLTVNFTGSGQFTLDPLGETIDLFTCPAIPLVAAEPSPFTCEGSNKSSVLRVSGVSAETDLTCLRATTKDQSTGT